MIGIGFLMIYPELRLHAEADFSFPNVTPCIARYGRWQKWSLKYWPRNHQGAKSEHTIRPYP